MKIYIIGKKGEFDSSVEELSKYGQVVLLDSGEKEIKKYPELFADPEEKIIGVAPGVIEWTFPVEDIKRILKLRGICTKSSWGFYIDIEYCKQNNIWVTNIPGANSRSVAEYAFWMMLSLAKNLPQQQRENFKSTCDDDHYQTEISDKKMGIIGLGKIGSHLAKMAQGFGMEVWYSGRKPKEVPYRFASVEEVLENADFVFDCLENCPETKNYLNKERLDLMKPTSYFISVMGGAGWGVEDDNHLVKMVEEGRLAGFSVENEHSGEFQKEFKGNVFVPGGYAWYTNEARQRSNKVFIESMAGMASGKVVNEIIIS